MSAQLTGEDFEIIESIEDSLGKQLVIRADNSKLVDAGISTTEAIRFVRAHPGAIHPLGKSDLNDELHLFFSTLPQTFLKKPQYPQTIDEHFGLPEVASTCCSISQIWT